LAKSRLIINFLFMNYHALPKGQQELINAITLDWNARRDEFRQKMVKGEMTQEEYSDKYLELHEEIKQRICNILLSN